MFIYFSFLYNIVDSGGMPDFLAVFKLLYNFQKKRHQRAVYEYVSYLQQIKAKSSPNLQGKYKPKISVSDLLK